MKTINRHKQNLVLSILQEKCPHCGEGHVFKKHTSLLRMPEMHDNCEVCHYQFDREPGYFLGAMYISYGIAIFAGLVTFLICHFLFPSLPTIFIPLSMVLVMLLIARKNYKLSRVIYIRLFPW
jgi:uncharacterized protein (DUF983 family)